MTHTNFDERVTARPSDPIMTEPQLPTAPVQNATGSPATSPTNKSSLDGAARKAQEVAAKLDERIAHKRQMYNGAVSNTAEASAPTTTTTTTTTTTKGPSATKTSPGSHKNGDIVIPAREQAHSSSLVVVYREPPKGLRKSSNQEMMTAADKNCIIGSSDLAKEAKSMPSPKRINVVGSPTTTPPRSGLASSATTISMQSPVRGTVSPEELKMRRSARSGQRRSPSMLQKTKDDKQGIKSSMTRDSCANRIRDEIAQLESEVTRRQPPSKTRIASPSQQGKGGTAREDEVSGSQRNNSERLVTITRRETPTRIQLSDHEQEIHTTSTSTPRSGRVRSAVRPATIAEPGNTGASTNQEKMQSPFDDPDYQQLDRLESGTPDKCVEPRSHTVSPREIFRISTLEERIAYKTGIPLDTEGEEDDPAAEQRTSFERCVSKLAGAPPPIAVKRAGGATLEKAKELKDGDQMGIYSHQGATTWGSEHDDKDMSDVGEIVETLAIAVAVDGEKTVIPAAIEYDPASSSPKHKNRCFLFSGLMCCALVLLATACAVVLSSNEISSSDLPSDPEPSLPPRHHDIQQRLEKQVGRDNLTDPDKVEHRALEWLVYDDGLDVEATSEHLGQRFLLAVFYFKTHEEGTWLSCNAPSEAQPDDSCGYYNPINFFPTEVYEVEERIRWLSAHHECRWAGILCDDDERVVGIDLTAQGITGTLPTELTSLESLQAILLGWNNFYGSIPEEYTEMTRLAALEVHHNVLTGTLPAEWSKMKSLLKLNVASNVLTGSLPTGLGDLSLLRGFFAYGNSLSGTFPTELMQLPMLGAVRIQSNFFSGTLATHIGGLAAIWELWMHDNHFSGSVPSEVGNLRLLSDLRLQNNTRLTGAIPDEMYQLSKLWRLDLSSTQITGTISSDVSQLSHLRLLLLHDNHLSGMVPVELGDLTLLEKMKLHGTDLSGEIPQEICDLEEGGKLQFMSADCRRSSPESETIPITCSCCQVCCERDTDACFEV